MDQSPTAWMIEFKGFLLDLKQAYILRIFVPGADFGPGRIFHWQPAWTAGWELFGVVHGRGSSLRSSL